MDQRPRGLPTAGLHLAVLWSFAVAKPLFDVLSDDPSTLIARSHPALDIVVVAIGLVLVPPALLLGLEAAVELVRRGASRPLHLVLIGLLAAALAIQPIKDLVGSPAALPIGLALVAGGGFAALYATTGFLPKVLTVLSPAPAVFALLFLVASPISQLVLPQEIEDASASSISSDAPVVVLVFDEFPLLSLLDREGEIDEVRYPNFARLASDADWYPRATSVSAYTRMALPALLAGEHHGPDAVPFAGEYPRNLFTLLEGHYRERVEEVVTQLCPEDTCERKRRGSFGERMENLLLDLGVVGARRLLPDSITTGLPEVEEGFGHFLDSASVPQNISAFDGFLSEIGPEPSSLYFFHAYLPHVPWKLLPDGRRYPLSFDNPPLMEPPDLQWPADQPSVVRHFWQRHLLQVGFADRQLGRLIDRMKSAGIWEQALVVVTADHGGAFRPGVARRAATRRNLAEIAAVPLFVKAPAQPTGRVVPRRVCTRDILPLITRILGLEPPLRAEACPREITLSGKFKLVSGDAAAVEAQLAALAVEKARLFGSGEPWREIYRAGDRWGLVGRDLAELELLAPGEVTVNLIDGGLKRRSRPGSPVVNSLVTGEVSEEVAPGDRFVVAVGGRVEAIGIAYELEGETGIAAMVPPDSLNRGKIELFRLLPGNRPRLEPVPIES